MGEAQLSRERLLIVFDEPLPAPLIAEVNRKFSPAEVTVYYAERFAPLPSGQSEQNVAIQGSHAEGFHSIQMSGSTQLLW